MDGLVWEVVLWTPAFWATLGDFEYIGLLARTACAFRLAVQWNTTAWLEVSKHVPSLPVHCISEVFCVSATHAVALAAAASPTDSCHSIASAVMGDSSGPKRVFWARRRRTEARCSKGASIRRTRWPDSVLFRRFDRLLLGILCAYQRTPPRTVVSNRRLAQALLHGVHANVSGRLQVAVVNRYLWHMSVAHGDCVERRWHANILMWKFDVHRLAAALRPLSHARVLRAARA